MLTSLSELEHARAFAPQIVDVPSLNAKVSDAVLECIDHVRKTGARAATASLLVLGPAGAGKTHLFERTRRRAGQGATLVHLRPEIGIEPSLRHVLLTVLDAMKQPVADQDCSQLDVVVGAALARVEGESPKFAMAFLEKARDMSAADRESLIERALDYYERVEPGIEVGWLELLFSSPFLAGSARRSALTWLSGREPSELELRRVGRSEALGQAMVRPSLRALATIAAEKAPLVIVFDQLENLVEADGRVDRIHAHARVYSELHDDVRGLVLVQMALDGEWIQRIRPELGASERSRLESRVLSVELPNAEQREQLLHAWLERLPPSTTVGPFPAPFTREDWNDLRALPGTTPRMLFVAARKALAGEAPFPRAQPENEQREEIDEVLARHWQEALKDAHRELERASAEKRGIDPSRLLAAIRALLLLTPGTSLALVASERPGCETLRFQRGSEETYVFVVQGTHARSVAASLGVAVARAEGTKTIIVREQSLTPPPTWRAVNELLERLRRMERAAVLEPSRSEVARALALHDLLSDARSEDLAGPDGRAVPEEVVRAWARWVLLPEAFALALGEEIIAHARDSIEPPAPEPAEERESLDVPFDPSEFARPAQGVATRVLENLRLASIERVLAKVQTMDPNATRARVVEELRAHPAVRMIDHTLFYLVSESS